LASPLGIEVQSYRIGKKKKSNKMLVINTFFTKKN